MIDHLPRPGINEPCRCLPIANTRNNDKPSFFLLPLLRQHFYGKHKWRGGRRCRHCSPKIFWKAPGRETWANNVRCNQPRARKNEAPHANCTAAAHSFVLDSDGARCVNSLSLFFFGKWELLRIRFSIDNRWKAERRRITTAENQSANHTAARLLQSE